MNTDEQNTNDPADAAGNNEPTGNTSEPTAASSDEEQWDEQPGDDIGVHASISVAQGLLAAGVVDELRLVIAPRIAGQGRRLLDGLPPIHLEETRATTTPKVRS